MSCTLLLGYDSWLRLPAAVFDSMKSYAKCSALCCLWYEKLGASSEMTAQLGYGFPPQFLRNHCLKFHSKVFIRVKPKLIH